MEKEASGSKLICDNKKARFDYQMIETFEAGLVLSGAEIKSVRHGGVSLVESYVRPEGNEFFVIGMNIKPYDFLGTPNYNPTRKRKLLLHKKEIDKLRGGVEKKGLTIIPLKLYLKGGYAKMLVALAKGKAAPDKRESIKRREADREARRAIKGKK